MAPDKVLIVPANPAHPLSPDDREAIETFLGTGDPIGIARIPMAIYQRIGGVWRYCGPCSPVAAGDGVQIRVRPDGSLVAERVETSPTKQTDVFNYWDRFNPVAPFETTAETWRDRPSLI